MASQEVILNGTLLFLPCSSKRRHNLYSTVGIHTCVHTCSHGGDAFAQKLQLKIDHEGVPIVAQWVTNPTSIHEDVGSIRGLAQWVKDLTLLWLWCRPTAAVPI